MRTSYLIWGWIVSEILFFTLSTHAIGFFLTILLLLGFSILGGYLMRQHLLLMAHHQRAISITNNEDGFKLVGAFLLLIPGLISSILGLIFSTTVLRKLLGKLLWQILDPEKVYGEYEETFKTQVEARRSDGSKIEAELIDTPKKRRK